MCEKALNRKNIKTLLMFDAPIIKEESESGGLQG